MAQVYATFEEIKEPKLRRTIEGLAKLYFNGDVNAALIEYNLISEEVDKLIEESKFGNSMEIQLRFTQ